MARGREIKRAWGGGNKGIEEGNKDIGEGNKDIGEGNKGNEDLNRCKPS